MESNDLSWPVRPSCSYLTAEIREPARICLNGELDLGSLHVVAHALAQLESEAVDTIVLDLSGIGFMDCSGLSTLVGAHNRAQRDGRRLIITNVEPSVRRIFALTGCLDLLANQPDAASEPREPA